MSNQILKEQIEQLITIKSAKILAASDKIAENRIKNELSQFKEEVLNLIPIVEQGPRGYEGPPGPEGKQGLQGEKGEKGDTGPKGDQGNTGLQGEKGEKGDQGIQGPQGEKGETGKQGKQGIQGKTGKTGTKGPKGDKGPPGKQGKQGKPGKKGEKGEKGDAGKQGPKGEKGEKGATGPKGPKGEKGAPGKDGSKGPPGESVNEELVLKQLTKLLNEEKNKAIENLYKEFNEYKQKLQVQLSSLGGGGTSSILDMDEVEFNYINQLNNDDILIFDSSIGEYGKFKTFNIQDAIDGITMAVEKQYDKLIDENANTGISYIGEREPGNANTASNVWRIRKVDESVNPIVVLWANGNANTVHSWDLRETYTYTTL